ncbi:hypothetical protein [Halothiobacillus sp.]|nr:hypothetical protein [Halothiobacillus sp.]
MNALDIEKMTTQEQLQTMEALWCAFILGKTKSNDHTLAPFILTC